MIIGLLLGGGKHPEVLVCAGQDAHRFLVVVALFSEFLENVIGSASGACSGEGKGLELEQSDLIREIGQAFIGNVICQKGFTQLESCIDRTTINVAVASPDNRGMRLPYRPQCGETPPVLLHLGQGLRRLGFNGFRL